MAEDDTVRVSTFGVDGLLVVGWDDARAKTLTRAQNEIAHALVRGATYDEIAADRGTSRHTVDNQVQALYAYFDVNSRAEFVRIWAATDTELRAATPGPPGDDDEG